jgi:2-dehydropantoate 2-reductase
MKYAIYGAGAMGTILGAFLTRAGIEIDLINRNRAHIEGLKQNGATIIGTVQFVQPVRALLDTEIAGPYDIIFLMTKQLDNANIVKGLLPHLTTDGVICTMQNGLPELSVASIIGESKTYGCAVSWGATMIGNGICELTSVPSRESLTFSLGSYTGNRDAKFEEIKALLEIMGNVETHPNFMGARWSKLLVNSAFSGLSTITGATFGEIANRLPSRRIAQRIMKECIDVATNNGVTIEPIQGKDIVKLFNYRNWFKQQFSLFLIPIAMRKHRLLKSSMLQDLLKGKHCEIEAINGVVCAYGDKADFATPFNDLIVKIVKDIEAGKRVPEWRNIDDFQALLRSHR